MKLDITSGRVNLSRKIRLHILYLFLAVWMANPLSAQGNEAPRFNPLMKAERLHSLPPEEVVIIDTRSPWRYLFGHLPGAINLSRWQEFTHNLHGIPGILIEDKHFIAEKLRALGIDYDKTIVLYGDSKNKWRADGRFFWMFERFGFKKVALLDGGLESWEQAGGKIERGNGTDPLPSSLTPDRIRFDENAAADQGWIFRHLGDPQVKFVDNREKIEFEGATPYGSKRGGHIPGAIHIDWRDFFNPAGKLKPRRELMDLLNRHGIRRDNEVVVYCTGGVRSGMAYFAFRYLNIKTRNYDGSWWDWSSNPKLPAGS